MSDHGKVLYLRNGMHNALFNKDSPGNQMEVDGSKGHQEGQR